MLSAMLRAAAVAACADRYAQHRRVDNGLQSTSACAPFRPCLCFLCPQPPRYRPTRFSVHTHKHHESESKHHLSDPGAGDCEDSRRLFGHRNRGVLYARGGGLESRAHRRRLCVPAGHVVGNLALHHPAGPLS
ncbi:unnamed protein product [Sphagnum balticum]